MWTGVGFFILKFIWKLIVLAFCFTAVGYPLAVGYRHKGEDMDELFDEYELGPVTGIWLAFIIVMFILAIVFNSFTVIFSAVGFILMGAVLILMKDDYTAYERVFGKKDAKNE